VWNEVVSYYEGSKLIVEAWRQLLAQHPNRLEVLKTLKGIEFGEDLGWSAPKEVVISPVPHSMDPESVVTIRNNIAKRLEKGTILGPFAQIPTDGFRSSSIYAIPKSDGGKRIIHNLSSPDGLSVNDGLDMSGFDCTFSPFRACLDMIVVAGSGCLLAKMDWAGAYKQITVRPDQIELCGFEFDGLFYADTRLPFGARSSPAIFNRYSDQFEWIMRNVFGIRWTSHYADDHLLIGNKEGPQSIDWVMESFDKAARILGVGFSPDKRIGPTTRLTYLGIEINTENMTIRLPDSKISEILRKLDVLLDRKRDTLRNIQSIVGLLNFATRVLPAGRSFCSRLIAAGKAAAGRRAKVVFLGQEFHADIRWWIRSLRVTNGISIISEAAWKPETTIHVECDAAGRVGGGGVVGSSWTQIFWTEEQMGWGIAVLELVMVIVCCATWGHLWRGRHIMFHSDNMAVVCAIRARRVRDPHLMAWVRELHYLETSFCMEVRVVHIAGVDNTLADLISRGREGSFFTEFQKRFGHPPDLLPTPAVLPDIDVKN
jgi:hypothetical protein